MGIASIVASLAKGVPWTKVAGMAMEYAPGLYRTARERFQPEAAAAAAEEHIELQELQERLVRLEKLLLEQEEVIRTQAAANVHLEKRCQELESSLLALKVTAGVLTLGCIILLAVLFR